MSFTRNKSDVDGIPNLLSARKKENVDMLIQVMSFPSFKFVCFCLKED